MLRMWQGRTLPEGLQNKPLFWAQWSGERQRSRPWTWARLQQQQFDPYRQEEIRKGDKCFLEPRLGKSITSPADGHGGRELGSAQSGVQAVQAVRSNREETQQQAVPAVAGREKDILVENNQDSLAKEFEYSAGRYRLRADKLPRTEFLGTPDSQTTESHGPMARMEDPEPEVLWRMKSPATGRR